LDCSAIKERKKKKKKKRKKKKGLEPEIAQPPATWKSFAINYF